MLFLSFSIQFFLGALSRFLQKQNDMFAPQLCGWGQLPLLPPLSSAALGNSKQIQCTFSQQKRSSDSKNILFANNDALLSRYGVPPASEGAIVFWNKLYFEHRQHLGPY